LGSFFSNLGIWIRASGAAGHVSLMAYFSNFLEDKEFFGIKASGAAGIFWKAARLI
jgi:hypothetical protein